MIGLLKILCGAWIISVILLLLLWYQTQRTLQKIQIRGRNVNDISLTRSPTRLSPFELISITAAILKKYILVITGRAAQLRADPERDQLFALPSVLVRGLLEIDDDDFEKFRTAVPIHSSGTAENNKDSPFFLVATTGPLIPFILAHPNCPIKPLGAVNTRNTFVIQDIEFCRDTQAIKAASTQGRLSYEAAFGGPDRPGRRRQRGVEFNITIKILHDGEIILSQELGFLQFLPPSTLPKFKRQASSDESQTHASMNSLPSPDSQANHLDLSMSLRHPRQWAACCRDYNPIHISTLLAKVFGFRSVIAHGNHAVALVMQQLFNDPRCEDDRVRALARKTIWETTTPVTIDVKFVKPMVLPVHARVRWYNAAERTTRADFAIYNGSTKYTIGSCSV